MLRSNVPFLEKPAIMGFASAEMKQPARETQTLLFVIPKKANVFAVSENSRIEKKRLHIFKIKSNNFKS